MKKQVIRCHNDNDHIDPKGIKHRGKILVIFEGENIYIHCGYLRCKRWTKLNISFPGVKIDFSKAAIIREIMPEGYHFDTEDASTILAVTDE